MPTNPVTLMKWTESWKDVNYHNSYTEKGTLTRSIPTNEVESVINNLRNRKAAGPEGPTGKLYWTFKEEMIPLLYNLFQKNRNRENASCLISRPA